jgi:hypothetical protein
MADFKNTDAASLAEQCRNESEGAMAGLILDWTKHAEFERGNQNVFQSKKTRTVIKLSEGAWIPEKNAYFSEGYMPTLNHLGVNSDSITARGNANPLKPLVRPKTGDDEDRDAAKASTLALQSYDQTLDARAHRKEIVDWYKISGNAVMKVWWDRNLGDILPPLPTDTQGIDVQHLLDSDVEPKRTGDLQRIVLPTHSLIVSPGASSMKNIRYIGDMSAVDASDAETFYGVKVSPEDGLQDLRQLQAVDTVMNDGNGVLQGCVRVIDLYLPPSPEHPKAEQKQYGRHIITVGGKVVEDGVWDKALTEAYGRWHPYVKGEFLHVAGDFWGGTPYKDLCEDQTEINRQYRMSAGSKQIIRNILAYQNNGTIDVDKLRLTKHGQGLAVLPYEGNAQPNILNVHGNDDMFMARIEQLKRNMDDRVASYKVTRGDVDSTVTSGKQQQALMQASAMQTSPLSMSVASIFRDAWQLELQLLSVHLTQEKAIRLVGEDNEVISTTLKPEHLTSDDVEIEDLAAFLADPETRKNQIRQNYAAGLYGNPQDPAVRQKVARMLEIPFSEELDEEAKDVARQKWEIRAWARGELDETNPAILQRLQQQYQQAETMAQATPGLPPPPPPIMWKRPRTWENHRVHRETLNAWRKTAEFEQLCAEIPMLFEAVEFHESEHARMEAEQMAQAMAQMPPPQGPKKQANPEPPPSARGGISPPSRPRPNQPGPQVQGPAQQ